MQLVVQEALEQEVTDYLGRERYERRNEEQQGWRNGYEPGRIRSAEGEVRVQVPQVRGVEEPYRSPLMAFLRGNSDPLTLFETPEGGLHVVTIRNTPGSTLSLDKLFIMPPPYWPAPTPWPTPDATPFINTWDQSVELAMHVVNGWRWTAESLGGLQGNNRIQVLDALTFGLTMTITVGILISAVRRLINHTGGR